MVPSLADQLPKPTALDLILAAAELESRATTLIGMCADSFWDAEKNRLEAKAVQFRRVAGLLVVMASTPQRKAA